MVLDDQAEKRDKYQWTPPAKVYTKLFRQPYVSPSLLFPDEWWPLQPSAILAVRFQLTSLTPCHLRKEIACEEVLGERVS